MKHTKKITILHSNDLHGDFLAEQVDEKLVGGVSMLSGYIEKVRAEEPNTLYAIAGDMFRGSVIDSEYKGLSTIEIMNALAPDVVTIGNHEVDYGIAHLLFIEKCARFPIINANLYIKNTPTRLFTPYKILRVDGMNILFIGIITQDVINQTKSESLVGSFVDTAAAAAEVGKICNAHNSIDIDFTVLLTHIGFEEDKHLARQLDPAWGVDLIIGGHSHTFLDHAAEENGVVIAQAGTGTDQIGRFDIIVDTDNNCIDSYTWRTVPICAETCPRNPAMEQVLHRFTSQVDEKYSHIVGRFRRELTHPERTQETELGNLFADIFTRSLGIDVMLIGSGSIRAEKLGPIVTYGDLIEGFPYDDGVYMFKVTGRQLRQMLHYMLREEAYTGHTEFYQLPSTLRLRYDRASRRDTCPLPRRGAGSSQDPCLGRGRKARARRPRHRQKPASNRSNYIQRGANRRSRHIRSHLQRRRAPPLIRQREPALRMDLRRRRQTSHGELHVNRRGRWREHFDHLHLRFRRSPLGIVVRGQLDHPVHEPGDRGNWRRLLSRGAVE